MIDNQDRIIEGLKNGDKLIFEEVYREYYIPLCYYCVKYVEKIEDSEEIVQDLFLRLWEKHKELEINSSLKAYLYRAIQNYALNFLNKKKTQEKYILFQGRLLNDAFDNGVLKLEEEELHTILKHAILRLPEKRRRIFELSRFDGLQYGTIAGQLSISVKTVEAQMTKALKYLRVVLKDYIPALTIIVLNNTIF
ncbi:MAG: RNA polymerase sigma-70 factor [Bacteroidetes bacterium]|nr:RNA polymerase sigma-70 factor [Bacteroidota bacterium]MBL6943854.1 RNA polymerase sigma-70 factor [Bacteroidales bacterium]